MFFGINQIYLPLPRFTNWSLLESEENVHCSDKQRSVVKQCVCCFMCEDKWPTLKWETVNSWISLWGVGLNYYILDVKLVILIETWLW